jgi:hypothetical protein
MRASNVAGAPVSSSLSTTLRATLCGLIGVTVKRPVVLPVAIALGFNRYCELNGT